MKFFDVEASQLELFEARFGVAGSGLLVAVLPVRVDGGDVIELGTASCGGERPTADHGVGRAMHLRQGDLQIFPPASVVFAVPGISD